jgi:hypothetical protein
MLGRLLTAIAVLGLLGLEAQAADRNDADPLFRSDVIGATPGMIVAGVNSGGAPWVVRQGRVSITANGMIHLEVRGLLLGPGNPKAGTTGPVTAIAASLVCGGGGGTIEASTGAVPLNSLGNAEIRQAITLPPSCLGPVVLVRIFNSLNPIGSQLGPFIAASGFASSSVPADH